MINLLRPLTFAFLLILPLVTAASAGPPTDQLRGSVDNVLKVLSDPEMRKEAKTAERRRLIRVAASEIFDFTEISRRTLATHWQGRTPAERQQFTTLFGELLEHSYISKIEGYSGEKIQYVGETIDGDQAVVRTKIISKQGTETPVDYRMLLLDGRWKTYDVTIEGVSLVANYRAQFNSIIRRSGYPDLVAKLSAKQDPAGTRQADRGQERSGAAGGATAAPVRQAP